MKSGAVYFYSIFILCYPKNKEIPIDHIGSADNKSYQSNNIENSCSFFHWCFYQSSYPNNYQSKHNYQKSKYGIKCPRIFFGQFSAG